MSDFETRKAESVKKDYLVYKPNPLLLARDDMALMQARFFTAYLCKVNPSDPSTYRARFSFDNFCDLLEIDKRNIKRIREAGNAVMHCNFDFAEYTRRHADAKLDPRFQKIINLFETFTIDEDKETGELYVEVSPTRPMESLLEKQHTEYGYVSYKAENTLRLSTKRNMRMYEFLKRHEGIGVTVDIPTLKAYLGLTINDYPAMRDFRSKVLEKAIKEINQKTDILARYVPRKKGQGGKICGFKFRVETNYRNKTSEVSEEHLPGQIDLFANEEPAEVPKHLDLFVEMEGLENFTIEEIDVLVSEAKKHFSIHDTFGAKPYEIKVYDYIFDKIKLMKSQHNPVENKYSWLRKAIINDWQ